MKDVKWTSLLCVMAILAITSCTSEVSDEVKAMGEIPVLERNVNYPSNREPLMPQRFIKLPTGSIKPGGWILTQLELQKDGLNGHLGEISAWLQKEDNAWLKAGGHWGWEEVPYWLRGYP